MEYFDYDNASLPVDTDGDILSVSSPGSSEGGHDSLTTPIPFISATFNGGPGSHASRPNVIIASSDGVIFYVHLENLLLSQNGLHGALCVNPERFPSEDDPLMLSLAVESHILNIILHTLYGISCDTYHPTLEQMVRAIGFLKLYDCSLTQHLAKGTPLYNSFLGQSPLKPIEAYTIAAENSLEELASAISPHLLSYHLANCPDDLAERMGGLYFKRMHALQDMRVVALREMILAPPYPHGPTRACDFGDQKALNRAWAMASAQLAWDARPDLAPSAIERVLGSLDCHLRCPSCKEALEKRVNDIVVRWSTLTCSI